MSAPGTVRVTARYWSNHHGAGRVTARARGTQRTVTVDPATSGGFTLDGTYGAAVTALAAALGLPAPVTVPEPVSVSGTRRTYLLTITDERH